MELHDPNSALLARYLGGECSAAERDAIEQWAGADPAHQAQLDRLSALWVARAPAPVWDLEGMWRPVAQTIEREAGSAGRGVSHAAVSRVISAGREEGRGSVGVAGGAIVKKLFRGLPRPFLVQHSYRRAVGVGGVLVAAILVVAASGAALWFRATHEAALSAAPVTVSEVVTRRGERARLRLPDGTDVVLAPGSSLRYASDYGMRRREVMFDGEGMFTVTHDETRPFTVRTKRAIATDLGTTFVVRAYGGEAATDVVVTEGIVRVTPSPELAAVSRGAPQANDTNGSPPADTGALLRAGDGVRIAGTGGFRVRRSIETGPYLAWAEGRLVFDDASLADVAARLEQWYDITVVVADAGLARRHFTGSYRDESWSDIVRLIAASLDARVERNGRTVTFRAR